MDLFQHLPEYRVIVCLACGYAIPPASLESHIRTYHRKNASVCTLEQRRTAVQQLLSLDLLDPALECVPFPRTESPPVPQLPTFRGLFCLCRMSLCSTLRVNNGKALQDISPLRQKARPPVGYYAIGI